MSVKILVIGIVCALALGFSSCKTTRVVPVSVVKPISTNKLIRNIESNAFDYKHLSIKRINCQFDNGKTKASFKASILAEKDKRITVLLSKLNIPVGRLWLTPDSVKFVNYLEKNYFLDDYSYLSSMLDMDIDFDMVHAIISNNIFALGDEKRDKEIRDYQSKIDSGMYVLESEKGFKDRKESQRISDRRQARKSQKLTGSSPVHQSIYVDPETFKLRKVRMEDAVNSRIMNMLFSDFTTVGKQLYPGEINLQISSPENHIQLRIKLSGFSTEEEKDIRFKVPEKYTRINR
ncbi:MAG: DUF4292 domain-containing protein [Prolixibacteraceae bacterium]|nr:DUF4292 domain-containing protein [Prolixibacteraceae bacterium]